MKKYYVLFVWGDVEPETFGPFENEDERDEKAKSLRREEGEEHGIYALQTEGEKIQVTAYSGAFFEDQKATVKLFYRCGGNYKYHFDIEVFVSDMPEGVKAGDESVEIESFGMTPSEMYTAAGVTYDSELDHNLVDVLEIIYETETEEA